jgi:hypothetical protein
MKVCLLDAMLPQLLPRLRAEILEAPGLRIRIRINLSCWIRIRIQIADPDPDPGGQKNDPQKQKKIQNFHVLKC